MTAPEEKRRAWGAENQSRQRGGRPRNEAAEAARRLPADAMVIVPLRDIVLFPGIVAPITVGRRRSVAAAEAAAGGERCIGAVCQRQPETDDPTGRDDLFQVGTIAEVLRTAAGEDGIWHVVCQGEARFRVIEWLEGYPFMAARIQRIDEPESNQPEIEARLRHLKEQALEALELLPDVPQELVTAVQNIESASLLADMAASYLDLKATEKQEVLECFDIRQRLDKVSSLLGHRIEVLRISREIGQDARKAMEQRQREFILREQLQAIQRKLGEEDGRAAEIDELSQAIAKAGMPEEVEVQARKELRRLEQMPETSAEHSMIRTYLDWMISLPWSKLSDSQIDIPEARRILEEEHYGLDKIKRRILEFLAVRKLNPEGKSPILCFVGPPGVGKTSLGQSIARATGREFVRVALGGVHDEAEIRGHRRTYVGAMPGNIIQALRKAGTRNCVLMLDEIDKLGAGGFHGDPSAAFLEVLDPEQNHTFRDNYLGVPFDLSKVMFICTANVLEGIPGPLRDRVEIISLVSYTEKEKLEIAKRYLLARQMKNNGLTPEQVEVTDEALRALIRYYTREAGVRGLERNIGAVLRRIAMQVAEGRTDKAVIREEDLHDIVGPRKFENEMAMRTSVPGVVTGLAWTPVGGDILFIEATRMPGSGKLILTGQLGDVMRESAQAALSLVKSRAKSLGLESEAFDKSDIHIHCPAGAIPKDGPSAGVAMFTALVSAFTGRCLRSDTAMTGEISLRGLVLPVGGIKEKSVAAATAGITRVLMPKRNEKDWEDIPEDARDRLDFVWVESVDELLTQAFDAPVDRLHN
ncbi:endopeptidase La [Telmatospirillum sp. J64-1]|uniref:endopeptidase La n=1 Tax=Telmatospirillum sp. J64-1 TaxID=2502183 RepID=UPI00115D03AC|nr:endopeptidase La [Telmatospirillum sp. J64-1]